MKTRYMETPPVLPVTHFCGYVHRVLGVHHLWVACGLSMAAAAACRIALHLIWFQFVVAKCEETEGWQNTLRYASSMGILYLNTCICMVMY